MATLTIIVLFLTSMIVGMIIGLIGKPKYIYRGPNAHEHISKLYHSQKFNRCYQFSIRLVECPQSLVRKVVNRLKN